MVEQNAMTIIDLCDGILEMISTETEVTKQRRVKAVTTIASVWRGSVGRERYRVIKRNFEYLCLLSDIRGARPRQISFVAGSGHTRSGEHPYA